MLKQVWKIKKTLKNYLNQDINWVHYFCLELKNEKWNHVNILLFILKLFFIIIKFIEVFHSITVQYVFHFYNHLINHLKNEIEKWKNQIKTTALWQKTLDTHNLVKAMHTVKDKLTHYYSQIEDNVNLYYNLEIILNFSVKMSFYAVSFFLVNLLMSLLINS